MATRTVFVLTASLLASILPGSVSAGDTVTPHYLVGQRVRLKTTYDPTTRTDQTDGELQAIEGADLVIQQGSTRTRVPLTFVRQVDVHMGSKRATKTGFWTGSIILGLVGGTLGLIVGQVGCDEHEGCTTGEIIGGTVAYAVLAGAVGGGIGAAIGSQLEVDVWKRIDTHRRSTGLSLQPTRGGVRASFVVRF